MESWAGPGNKAKTILASSYRPVAAQTFIMNIVICHFGGQYAGGDCACVLDNEAIDIEVD